MKSGVEAFRIDAVPAAILVYPHTMRQNGKALLSNPRIKNFPAIFHERGYLRPESIRITLSRTPPMSRRSATTVKVPKLCRAMPLNTKAPPHIDANVISNTQRNNVMDFIIEIVEYVTLGRIPNLAM